MSVRSDTGFRLKKAKAVVPCCPRMMPGKNEERFQRRLDENYRIAKEESPGNIIPWRNFLQVSRQLTMGDFSCPPLPEICVFQLLQVQICSGLPSQQSFATKSAKKANLRRWRATNFGLEAAFKETFVEQRNVDHGSGERKCFNSLFFKPHICM